MERVSAVQRGLHSFMGYRLFHSGVELLLRLPGLWMLELWFRARGEGNDEASEITTTPQWTREFVNEKFTSVLEMVQLLEFVQSRNLDASAAQILSYSTLFVCGLFMLLPISRLISVYLHALSFALLAVGHYMSVRYVQLEMAQGGEVILDDFTRLERHGFHFLAQVMLGISVSCLLGIQRDLARASLAIYTAPIVARMCGFPIEKLHVVHNFSCSFAMLTICFYLLNTGPSILLWMRRAYRQVRASLIVRGLWGGSVMLFQRLRIPAQLCTFWLALFLSQLYAKQMRSTDNILLLLLATLAESTATPLSLLSLAVSVSYSSSLVLLGAKWCLFGSQEREDPVPIMHAGYTEGLTLILLCVQTGVLELKASQRAFLLGLVLFIVLSALFQALFDLLEPQLLSLGASRNGDWTRHVRALLLATFLFAGPVSMALGISQLLPVDLWLLIIVSNCLLTSLQTASSLVMYLLFSIEAHASEPWECLDASIYYCRAVTRVLEFALALLVIAYGLYESVFGRWSWLSAGVLMVHSYFNVWRRLQSGWESFRRRQTASAKINLLANASSEQLEQLSDVCSICFMNMTEARVTPCGHFFHGTCLRKWLFVRQSCPMCHADLKLEARRRSRSRLEGSDAEEGYSSEEEERQEDNESEYTLASSSDDE